MEANLINRNWKLEYGNGDMLIVILPRMDYKCINNEEWEILLQPFLEDAYFLILDMPEKLSQEKVLDFTVKDIAYEVNNFLTDNNLIPNMIWGISLGGMIAQELSTYEVFKNIPLILISTNLFADTKLRAIFSSWSLMVNKYGIEGFDLSLIPWISDARQLPILNEHINKQIDEDDSISLIKIKASLKAVSLHDARETSKNTKVPVKVLFGEYSVLLGKIEAEIFKKYIPNVEIKFIKNSGMRVLNDNKEFTVPLIKEYIRNLI